MLGDADLQHSARLWLSLRPSDMRPISTWQMDGFTRPPAGTTHVVLDTPAGLEGTLLNMVMRVANKMIIPLQPGVFDMAATRTFLDQIAQHRDAANVKIGIVGMRVDARTLAADKLHEFVDGLGLPVLGYLRHTQNYIQLAARGLTLFDLAPNKVEKDLEQWQEICRWIDAPRQAP
jgi:chromosome partitioning protein